jgi:cytochrome c biogenesis protein CcmG, thiol:disulfide interchange protein DsbE
LPSTPSSASAPRENSTHRPSRAAIGLLVFVSLAIPGGALALILHGDADHSGASSSAAATPTTAVAPTDSSKAKVGAPAPDFRLQSTNGSTLSLSTLRGHPVVVAFYASWCHPCEEELPVLEQFARDDADRLRVIGVSFQDLPSDSVAFVKRLHVTFPALLDDPSSPIANRYGVRGIPQTVFVDARGIVRGRVYGQTSRKALQPAIDDLLAGVDIRPV